MNAAPLAPVLTAPLPGSAPAGEDLTYDPHFQELAAEVDKDRSLGAATPDWRKILEMGIEILQGRSKDLRVAAWVVVAQAHLGGWTAVAEGLDAYASMLESFWDTALPVVTRPKARVTLAEWLWAGLGRALGSQSAGAGEREALERVPALVAKIDHAFSSRLQKDIAGAADFRKLARARLEQLPAAAPAPPPPAPATPPPVVPAPVPQAPAAQVQHARVAAPALPAPELAVDEPAQPASLDEAEVIARRLQRPLETFARYVRTLAPTAAWGYRLARMSAWFSVEGLPYIEGGRTTLRAPSSSDRTALERMATDGNWSELLETAEDALLEHAYWLDLHRYSAMALDNLGRDYTEARATVGRELVTFLARVPDLETQSFENRSPLASPATLAWIDMERARFGGGARPASEGTTSNADAELTALLDPAQVQAAGGPEAAIAKALAVAQAPRTRPDRFRATLAVANFALAHEQNDAALALFERLYPEVDETLEAWEPAVCKEFLIGYLKALGKPSEGTGSTDRQTLLFRRLLALDPASAFKNRA